MDPQPASSASELEITPEEAQAEKAEEAEEAPIATGEISTTTIILWVIIGLVLLAAAGIGLYYLVLKPKDNEAAGNQADTADEGDGEGDDASGDGDAAEVLTYTNALYPNIVITYDSTWALDDEETPGNEEGSTALTVTFTREDHVLTYSFDAISVYGGVPVCYLNDDIEYTQIEGHWARIVQDGGYYYDEAATVRDVEYDDEASITFAEMIAFFAGDDADPNDYALCTDDAPIGTSTSQDLPEDNPGYSPGAKYRGLVSITLDIDGVEDSDIVAEADEIVLGTEF